VKFLYPIAITICAAFNTNINASSTGTEIYNESELLTTEYFSFRKQNSEFSLSAHFVELSAIPFANHIKIGWKVSDEVNGKLFSIERSSNGISFELIGSVNAMGRSSYSFFDYNPLKGKNFYRITFVEKDGKQSLSRIFDTDFSSRIGLKAVVGYGKIMAIVDLKESGSYELALVNSYGQPVYKEELKYDGNSNTFEIPLNNSLPAGIYSIMVHGGKGINISCQVLLK